MRQIINSAHLFQQTHSKMIISNNTKQLPLQLRWNAITKNINLLILAYFYSVSLPQNITPEQIRTLMTINQECMAQSGVSNAVITNTLMGNFNYDPKLAQHLLCMSQRLRLQDANGKIDRNVLRQRLSMLISDPSQVENLVNKCGVDQEAPEQTAFKAAQCFFSSVRSSFMGK